MATIETNPQLGAQVKADAKEFVLHSWSVQARQAGDAALTAATAAPTSSVVARSTSPVWTPHAGS